MRLTIENLAFIKKADISLNGITCIAGVNNVGKSTVGKTIFALIYSLTNYQQLFMQERINFIESNLRFLRYDLQGKENNFKDRLTELRLTLEQNDMSRALEILESFEEQLSNGEKAETRSIERMEKMKKLILQDEESEEVIVQIVNRIFSHIFSGQVAPLHSSNQTEIKLTHKSDEIVSITMNADDGTKVALKRELPLNQAIYIESPYVFQFLNTYQQLNRIQPPYSKMINVNQIPLYINDLLYKMLNSRGDKGLLKIDLFVGQSREQEQHLYDSFRKLIDGEMMFDEKIDEFVFTSDKIGQKIKMSNIASGVKSLAIIQKLVHHGWLDEMTILVIDEPENHLHPKWQVAFAKFLVELHVILGIKVLVTSHSPYFIEALEVFTKKNKSSNKMAFYEANFEGEGTVLRDVTNHLSEIYELLSEPLDFLEEERL